MGDPDSFLPLCLPSSPPPCLPEDVRLTLCFSYYTPFAGQLDLWMFRATPGTIDPFSGCSGNFSGAPMSAFGNRECPSLFLCFTPSHCAGEIGLGGVNPGCLLCPLPADSSCQPPPPLWMLLPLIFKDVLTVKPHLARDMLYHPGWPQLHRDPLLLPHKCWD